MNPHVSGFNAPSTTRSYKRLKKKKDHQFLLLLGMSQSRKGEPETHDSVKPLVTRLVRTSVCQIPMRVRRERGGTPEGRSGTNSGSPPSQSRPTPKTVRRPWRVHVSSPPPPPASLQSDRCFSRARSLPKFHCGSIFPVTFLVFFPSSLFKKLKAE